MLAEVGVDSGGAAPASGWRSPSLPGPPDWATGANSHCTKIGARVQLWLGEGASRPGTRKTCQALPRFLFGSLTPRVIWRPSGGWIQGRALCASQAALAPGLERPSLQLGPSWFLPLFAGRNPETSSKVNLCPTLSSPGGPPLLSPAAVGLVGHAVPGKVPGNSLSNRLEKRTQSSLWPPISEAHSDCPSLSRVHLSEGDPRTDAHSQPTGTTSCFEKL